MREILEGIFIAAVNYTILAIEAVGVAILMITVIRAIISLFRNPKQSKRLMADGIAIALSFLLSSEVLKTIVAPDWRDMGMTCAILLMRAAMSLLIHWESKHE